MKSIGLELPLYSVKVKLKSKGRIVDGTWDVILPHEAFNAIHKHGLMSTVLGELIDHNRNWQAAAAAAQEWFKVHPLQEKLQEGHSLDNVIGYSLFGDDARFRSNSVLEVLMWSPDVCMHGEPFKTRIPCYVIPHHVLAGQDTLQELDKVICWSFQQMLNGTFLSSDHLNVPLPRRSWRGQQSDKQLAGGLKAALAGICRDWKWEASKFQLPWNYGCIDVCQRCACQSDDITKITEAFPICSMDEYFPNDDGGVRPALSYIPGWHRELIHADRMHSCCLGLVQQLVGSTMVDFCLAGDFVHADPGGPWQARMQVQLDQAYEEFCSYARDHGKQHSQPPFRVLGLNMKVLSKSFPRFKGKAANTMLVLSWMTAWACTTHGTDTSSDEARSYAADICFVDMESIVSHSQVYRISKFVDLRRSYASSQPWLHCFAGLQSARHSRAHPA